MLDDLRQQNNRLMERKSTSPEGVKPQRAARVKRGRFSLMRLYGDYCTFKKLLYSRFFLPYTGEQKGFWFNSMVYSVWRIWKVFQSKLELTPAPAVARMPVGNCWPKSNMLVFCQHVVHKPKQSLWCAVRAATRAATWVRGITARHPNKSASSFGLWVWTEFVVLWVEDFI